MFENWQVINQNKVTAATKGTVPTKKWSHKNWADVDSEDNPNNYEGIYYEVDFIRWYQIKFQIWKALIGMIEKHQPCALTMNEKYFRSYPATYKVRTEMFFSLFRKISSNKRLCPY